MAKSKNPKKTAKPAVPPASRAKKSASPKQTGGGGGIFEEEVIAYFLADLLTGRSSFEYPVGRIIRLDTQRPAAIWSLDDLLLVVEAPGKTHKLACSVKSNAQFTPQGFPADFVVIAWQQLLAIAPRTFDPALDLVGFITAPLNADYATDLSDLLHRARQQDPATLAQEIDLPGVANERVRRLYHSFACPADLAARYPAATTLTGWGLARLIWQPFDFELLQSQRVVDVRERLRATLVVGTASEAAALWEALVAQAKLLRPHAGSRTLPRLADELRYRFRLLAYPDDRADWARIREAAESAARQLPQRIGGQLLLPRVEERAQLQTALTRKRAAVLRGPSGTGKSVLAGLELLGRTEPEPVLWVDAEQLRGKTLTTWRQELGLQTSLTTLLRQNTAAGGLCVVDRLDKIYDNQTFAVVAELITLLRLTEENSPWQLLLPSVGEEWERVQYRLLAHGITPDFFEVVAVGVPTFVEQQQVWAAFPQLAPLQLRPHLNEVLLRPKMLDILARSGATGQAIEAIIGETSVASLWLRDLAYQGGTIKQLKYATDMAAKQADTWQNSLINQDLPALNSEVIEELVQQRVCVKRPGRVAFEHDLYGDWLRLEQLRQEARQGSLVAYLRTGERLTSPLWQRAVRLYGVALLDEQPTSVAWQQLYAQLAGIPRGQLGQDLLLEATWYAADPQTHLHALWPVLTAHEGTPLHRLLTRFLHAATRPNERVLAFVQAYNPEQAQRAATWHRVPEVGYWPPLLLFLQQQSTLPFAIWEPVAKIAYTWLHFSPPGAPYRTAAAVIAVALGEDLLRMQQREEHWFGPLGQDIWPAVLAGAAEKPDQVAQLGLEAAGRRPLRFLLPPTPPDPDRPQPKSFSFNGPVRPQWAMGPARRVDEELQKAAWGSLALAPLLHAHPVAALELALALLIEEPKASSNSILDTNYGLQEPRDWQGAHYQNGPFLLFLEQEEALGIELLLQLEQRALAGWIEETTRRENQRAWLGHRSLPAPFVAPTIQLDLPGDTRTVTGSPDVYGWCRGAHPSSLVMTCALMALEKHCYNRLDAREDVTELAAQLLQRAASVAVLGVLAQVGKYQPHLFSGVLQPLLGSPELMQWDEWLGRRIGFEAGFFGLVRSQRRREELHEWQQLAHRKTPLTRLAYQYFQESATWRDFFAVARTRWQQRRATENVPAFYEAYIAEFDRDNYRPTPPIAPPSIVSELASASPTAAEVADQIDSVLYSVSLKRKVLDQGDEIPLSEPRLEELWAEVGLLARFEDIVTARASPISDPVALATAIAALLLRRGRQWLARYPERETWCRDVLLAGAQLLWDERNEETEQLIGISGQRLADFVADGLPIVWAEQPEEAEVRQAVGQMMLTAPAESLRRFVQRTSALRPALGEDYYRAAHLRLLRAGQWYQRQYPAGTMPYQLTPEVLAEATARFDSQRDDWLAAFLAQQLAGTLPALHTLTWPLKRPQEDAWGNPGHRRDLEEHPFNEELLAAAHAGLPTPVAQPLWGAFWQQTLRDTLGRLQPKTGESRVELEGFPREWDSWLFTQLVAWLPQLPAAEARRFWEPVLVLGLWVHEWVKQFLQLWTGVAFGQPTNLALHRVWCEMIDYALASPAWTNTGQTGFYHQGELWRALLGLDQLSRWRVEQTALAESLRPRWATWARVYIGNARNANALAGFLASPAAGGMVLEGLQWLARPATYRQPMLRYWDDVADSLADLLFCAWQLPADALRQDTIAFEAFKQLLGVLVARQYPLGLQLNQLVGQS